MANHVGPNTSRGQFVKATKWRQLWQLIRAELAALSEKWRTRTAITRDRSLQSKNGNYRNLIKENVFWTYLPWCLKSTIWRKSSMTWKNRHNFSKIWPKQELCYWSMLLLLMFTSTIYESQVIATLSESRLGYNFLVCLVWHPEQNRHAPGKNIYTRFQHQT